MIRLTNTTLTLATQLCAAVCLAAPLSAQVSREDESLSLSEAVARALAYHPSIRAAAAALDAANSAVGEARAPWFPRITLDASASRYEEPMLTSPIHEFRAEAIPVLDRVLYGGNATVGYELFDGGAKTARVRGARAEAAATGTQLAQTEMALIARVTASYLRVLTASGVLEANDRRIEALDAERRRVGQLLEQGAAAPVQVMRAEAAMASAEADRVRAAASLEVAQHDLARLVGASSEEPTAIRVVDLVLRDSAAPEDRSSLISQAGTSSPELRRARELLTAAEAGRSAAASAWLPRVSLFGALQGYGYPDGFSTEWQVGARLSYPIFTGGARSNAVARAGAMAEAAREQVRLAELATQETIDRALVAVRESHARVDATGRAAEHLAEVVRIEQLSLSEGAGTQTDYLLAEAELFAARATLVEARHAEIAARVELARVVGHLSPAWLAGALETIDE